MKILLTLHLMAFTCNAEIASEWKEPTQMPEDIEKNIPKSEMENSDDGEVQNTDEDDSDVPQEHQTISEADKSILKEELKNNSSRQEQAKEAPFIWPIKEDFIKKIKFIGMQARIDLKEEAKLYSVYDGVVISCFKDKLGESKIFIRHRFEGKAWVSIIKGGVFSVLPGTKLKKNQEIGKAKNTISFAIKAGKLGEERTIDPSVVLPILPNGLVEIVVPLKSR